MEVTMRLAVLLCLSAFLTACCSAEQGAERARALSQDELAKVYSTVEKAYRAKRVRGLTREPVSPELAKLQPEGVLDFGSTVLIHLSGCVDDKSYLHVEGLGKPQGEHRIVLAPGERLDSEQLWPRPR